MRKRILIKNKPVFFYIGRILLVSMLFLFGAGCEGYRYITSYLIESRLGDSLDSVEPSVDVPFNAEDYLDKFSCLGYAGPIGPWGPLGVMGPIDNPGVWSDYFLFYSSWTNMSGLGFLEDVLQDQLDTIRDGSLGADGPLGIDGPLGSAYDTVDIHHFNKQLQHEGVWSVLGPVGPLGALGPLGPLGPVGMPFSALSYGPYMSGGVVQRTVAVPYAGASGGSRTYELFERYPEWYAKMLSTNDVSFMVDGEIVDGETDEYYFSPTYSGGTVMTIVVIPEYLSGFDDYDLEIKEVAADGTEKNLAVSQSHRSYAFWSMMGPVYKGYIDWIQVANGSNTVSYKVKVTSHYCAGGTNCNYRLFVVGCPRDYIQTSTAITGDHQQVIIYE